MKKISISALLIGLFLIASGFNTENAVVPRHHILSGGPPKDGIPAILEPKFLAPEAASYINDSDQVIGIQIGGVARAYPIKILNWHEVVNDTVNGVPIIVTF